MKKVIVTLSLIALVFGQCIAQNTTDEQKIQNLIINSFDRIFSEKNMNSFSEFYTEDFILLENGEVWDKEKISVMMEMIKGDTSERKNSFDFIEVKISGNTAWVAYHNTATFLKKDKIVSEMRWLESASAIRTPDGWRLEMLHSTRK